MQQKSLIDQLEVACKDYIRTSKSLESNLEDLMKASYIPEGFGYSVNMYQKDGKTLEFGCGGFKSLDTAIDYAQQGSKNFGTPSEVVFEWTGEVVTRFGGHHE